MLPSNVTYAAFLGINNQVPVLTFVLVVGRHFEAGDKSEVAAAKLFSVPDFVGDACKAIASRVRGAVAQVQFDDFHKVWGHAGVIVGPVLYIF